MVSGQPVIEIYEIAGRICFDCGQAKSRHQPKQDDPDPRGRGRDREPAFLHFDASSRDRRVPKHNLRSVATTWDGLWVCREDFETRHPQDFVRGRADNQLAPDPRPDMDGVFIGPTAAIQTETEVNIQTEGGFYVMVEA